MTDYTELVKKLRDLHRDPRPASAVWLFDNQIALYDAAAAIEALDRLLDQNTQRCEALRKQLREAHESYERHLNEIEAQLPKREEVWKDVIGYEGLYQVSNQARVRNSKGQILKQCVKVGKCVYYKYVQLYKDGRYKMKYVHRIMAECFLPNPDNLPIINHKDEDGTNNRLDNLEWCTVEYNSNYGNAKRNMSRGKRRRAKMEVQDG